MHQPDKNASSFEAFLKLFSKRAFSKVSISVFAGYAFVRLPIITNKAKVIFYE